MAGEPMRTPPGVSADTSPTTAQVEAEREAAGTSSHYKAALGHRAQMSVEVNTSGQCNIDKDCFGTTFVKSLPCVR